MVILSQGFEFLKYSCQMMMNLAIKPTAVVTQLQPAETISMDLGLDFFNANLKIFRTLPLVSRVQT